MSRPLILGVLGALLATTSALALEEPTPGPRDKRVRVIAYDPDEVVQLHAAPGSTVRIAIAPDETVQALLVSDQAIMSGESEVDATTVAESSSPDRPEPPGDPNKACDVNMCRSVFGSFIYIKPVRELEPQPLHIQTKRKCMKPTDGTQPKCEWRAYQFELLTRPGPLTEGTPNTLYSVRFDYPADRAAEQAAAERARVAAAAARARAARNARLAAARARADEADARTAENALRAQKGAVLNQAYTVRGDRAVLGAAR